MYISKKDRDLVKNMFAGKCAYTGTNLLPDWQVDHVKALRRNWWLNNSALFEENHNLKNMLPAQRIVNHYKHSMDLEQFREFMKNFHLRITKLPMNPKVQKSIKTKAYMLEIARLFDITPNKPFSGIFYFETIKYDYMKKLTLKQMFQIAHAFGIDLFKAAMSHKLKDKTLPKEFYRNRFQKEYDEVFEELVSIGYAEKRKWQDLPFYHVTDEGEKQFRKQFSEIVNYKPEKERDLSYLKHRINFYCSYRYYRFCDDNSEHIISAYLNYWVKKYYVSHTTEDTITMFKNELASYYKRGLLA